MKRLKAGPELKLPDLRNVRAPAFVEDLYYDLKDRRLLPLVALGIVAIIAVPFLLSGGSDQPEVTQPVVGGPTASDAHASLTVVRSNPGLRDYRKRLHRKATDPFKQHFTAPQLAGTQLGSGENEASTVTGSTTSSNTSTTIRSTATSVTTKTVREQNGTVTAESETQGAPAPQGPSTSEGETGTGQGGSGAEGNESRWVGFAVDVRIKTAVTLPDGSVKTGEPVTLRQVRAPAPLPTEKTPVVTYLGANLKTGKLILMVSEEVTSVFGEGKCLMGTQACQLLEVETGMPVTFVYGSAGERFKITVTKIERVPIELPKNLENGDEADVGSGPSPQARVVDGLRPSRISK